MYSCTDGDRGPQISRGRGRLASESMQTLDLMRYAMTSPSHMGLNDYPKSNGKLRPLGIPSIRDRIVQEALRMALEPIYEADFSQYSFGFRPNRCTMDAVKYIIWSNSSPKKRYYWVIEGDISSYFDTIKHTKL